MARNSHDKDSGSTGAKPIKTKTAAQIAAERERERIAAVNRRAKEERKRQSEYDRRNK